MKKVITSSEEIKIFHIYFKDGNKKLLEAENMYTVIAYLVFDQNYSPDDIYKIEELSNNEKMDTCSNRNI
jgi:hypothetical protein